MTLSIVTLLSSATSDLLVPVEDVKEVLQLTDNAYDEELKRIIRRASARINAYCGYELTVQRYRVQTPSYGSTILQLPHRNLRTVLNVLDGLTTDDATALTATEYRADLQRGQLQKDEGWPWTSQQWEGLARQPEAGQEYLRWTIDYSAGFIPGGGKTSTWDGSTSTGPTLPADISDACLLLVKDAWERRTRTGDVQSERVGELSITYRDGASDRFGGLPGEVADILRPYRSII